MLCVRSIAAAAVLAVCAGAAHGADRYLLEDAGRPRAGATARALVVATPGVALSEYDALTAALEARGLDAWTIRFPVGGQQVGRIVEESIPDALARLDAHPVVLAGHGLGGTLAALAVAEGYALPDGLGLLGAPLRFLPVALTSWLAERAVPPLGADLGAFGGTTWNGAPVLPLLLGDPPLELGPASADWLGALGEWVREERAISLEEVEIPVWAGVGSLDNVAPPEAVCPMLAPPPATAEGPGATFVRFGYARFDPEELDHAGLLRSVRATRALARWAAGVRPREEGP